MKRRKLRERGDYLSQKTWYACKSEKNVFMYAFFKRCEVVIQFFGKLHFLNSSPFIQTSMFDKQCCGKCCFMNFDLIHVF